MLKLQTFMLTLSLFISQVSHAAPKAGEICDVISTEQNKLPGVPVCENIFIPQISQTDFKPVCESVVKEIESNPEGAGTFCLNEVTLVLDMKAAAERDPGARAAGFASAIGAGAMGAVHNAEHSLPSEEVGAVAPRSSEEMVSCQEKKASDFACITNAAIVLPTSLQDIMKLPIVVPKIPLAPGASTDQEVSFNKEQCQCLEKEVQKNFASSTSQNELARSLAIEKTRIGNLIFNAAGKKILNQFAANIEDVNFYRTTNVRALGGEEKAKGLLCNDMAELEKRVKSSCGGNGVEAETMKKRISDLLGAFGDFKDEPDLRKKFMKLQDEITNIRLDDSKTGTGRAGTFTRAEYDRIRFGIYKARPEVQFLNEVTDLALDHPVLGKVIQEEMKKKTPGHAIFQILKDESNPEVKTILQDMVNKNPGSEFYKTLGLKLRTTSTDDLGKFIMSTYDIGTDMHPGLKAIYRDTDLFETSRRRLHRRSSRHDDEGHNLIEGLAGDSRLLVKHFEQRCEKFRDQFVEAVCVKDDNFVDLADRENLNKFLSPFEKELNPALKDLLLCRMPEKKNKKSIFQNLYFHEGDKLALSDYWERKANPKNLNADRFSQIAQSITNGDIKSNAYLSSLVATGDKYREPASEFTGASFGASQLLGAADSAKDQAPTLQNLTQTLAYSNESATQTQAKAAQTAESSFLPNYAYSSPPPAVVEKEKKDTDYKSMLRNFLSNEDNKKEVDKHLSQTNNKDLEELARLKDELTRDNAKISDLLKSTEQSKLEAMQANVKKLESEYKDLEEETEDEEERTFSPSSNSSSIASAQTGAQSQSSGGSLGSGSASAGSSSTGGSSAGRTIASEQSAQSSAAVTTPGTVSFPQNAQGAIIIESSKVRSGEIAQSELSEELVSFVRANEPDIQTLKKLKETGVVLKFKILKNGVTQNQEIKVDYASLTPEAKQFLDRRIALGEKSLKLKEAQRSYSYNALKQILANRSRN